MVLILKRILFFFPVAIIMLINSLILYVMVMVSYVRYGGESVIYDRDDKATIEKIYRILKGGTDV